MYKVYFIDDEEWLINELKTIIDWEEKGFTICGYNSDPFDALEEILALKPTLVISDIYMDGINGLELAQRVYEKESTINFCFLSAYDKFEYAVKALKLGAVDYLTKPLKTNELLSVLSKVKDLQNKNENEEFWAKFVSTEEIDEERINDVIEQLKDSVSNKKFRFVVFNGKLSSEKNLIIREFRPLYINDEYAICVLCELNVNRLQDIVKKTNCHIGLGLEINVDGDIKKSLTTALYCSKQAFISNDKNIVLYDGDKKYLEFKSRIDKCENKYELKALVDGLEDFISIFNLNVYELNMIFNFLTSKALKQGVEFNDNIVSKKNIAEKFSNLDNLLIGLKDAFEVACYKSENSIINSMVKDVQLNFSKEQSLDSYAKKYGYNASYLSILFKKETGQSFTEYLISLRLSKAKELMLGTNLSVGEIAFLVGYNDYFHFTKSFKANVGCSPSEYRKRYEKKD